MKKLRAASRNNPQATLTMIAVVRGKSRTGTTKVKAKINLAKKVYMVDSHISLVVCLFSDSSDIWIPRASENASAIAMISIPPRITPLEWVLECKPTISPMVVITPDVEPKHKPTFSECFI